VIASRGSVRAMFEVMRSLFDAEANDQECDLIVSHQDARDEESSNHECDIKVLHQDVGDLAERLDRLESRTRDIADLSIRIGNMESQFFSLWGLSGRAAMGGNSEGKSPAVARYLSTAGLDGLGTEAAESHNGSSNDGLKALASAPSDLVGDPEVDRINREIESVRQNLVAIRYRLLSPAEPAERPELDTFRLDDEVVARTITSLMQHMELTVQEFQQSWFDLSDCVGYQPTMICEPRSSSDPFTSGPKSPTPSKSSTDVEFTTPNRAVCWKVAQHGDDNQWRGQQRGKSLTLSTRESAATVKTSRRWSRSRCGGWRQESA